MATFGQFKGRLFSSLFLQDTSSKYVTGLRQSTTNPGNIRIGVKGVGYDQVYAGLIGMPKYVRVSLKAASNRNAKLVANVAREYAPDSTGYPPFGVKHGGALRKSINPKMAQETGIGNWVATVGANTPYAHFVEMDAHPSYNKGWVNHPVYPSNSVFGARQGPPQGAHYMFRAMEDTQAQSHSNIRAAVQTGVDRAMAHARTGYMGKRGNRLDFNTMIQRKSFKFVRGAVARLGMDLPDIEMSGSSMTQIHPLDMQLRGLK